MKSWIAIGILFLASGCSSPPEADPAWTPAPDNKNQILLDREAEPIPRMRIEAPDGAFTATVPARLQGEIIVDEDYFEWTLDIGASYPVACWLYRHGVDMATAINTIAGGYFDELAASNRLEIKQIMLVEAGEAGGVPHLGAQWIFRGMDGGESAAGQLSVRTAVTQGIGLACLETELGFEETFSRVFQELAASLEIRGDHPVPYYSEITLMRIRGQTAGVQQIEFTLDKDGDTRINTKVSMAMATSPTDLMTSDYYDIQYSTPKGQLINQWTQSIDAGALTTDLSLLPETESSWNVEGTFQQKEISVMIEGAQLDSMLGQMRSVRSLIESEKKGGEATTLTWLASADPSRTVESTTRLIEKVDEDSYRIEGVAGALEFTGIADRMGSMKSGRIEAGPMSFELERLYQFGDF